MIYEKLLNCDELFCPITCEIAIQPVKTNCNHIFEKEDKLPILELLKMLIIYHDIYDM